MEGKAAMGWEASEFQWSWRDQRHRRQSRDG